MKKKILLVGDSIRLDYGKYLNDYVTDGVEICSKDGIKEAYVNLDIPVGSNGGDSSMVLSFIEEIKDDKLNDYNMFIFNCGLHDIKKPIPYDDIQIDKDSYRDNLKKIIEILKVKNMPVVFINTTPADRSRYGEGASFIRHNEDVIEYNKIAEEVMVNNGIKVIDMYGFTTSLGLFGDDLFRDHTHFTEPVIKQQAAYIAGAINYIIQE